MFDIFIERILSHEGGYVNHPSDPGGETNFGISKRAYPNVDIKNLTREEAIAIYKRDYWDIIDGDNIHPAIAFQFLDAAINSGVKQAIKWLQEAVGAKVDGVYGKNTKAAVVNCSEFQATFKFITTRLNFLTSLSAWPAFGKGWTRRMVQNIEYAAEDL